MGYINTGMGDRFGALIVSLMALQLTLVDLNPFQPGLHLLYASYHVFDKSNNYIYYAVCKDDIELSQFDLNRLCSNKVIKIYSFCLLLVVTCHPHSPHTHFVISTINNHFIMVDPTAFKVRHNV